MKRYWAALVQRGKPKARTKNTAICPRVTLRSGQYRSGAVPHPAVMPSAKSCSIQEAKGWLNPRLTRPPPSGVPCPIPVTDLRRDAAAALKRVRTSKQPVVITQRGRAAAVMLSVEEYERAEHERQILRLLARGDREIAAGKGRDLDRGRSTPP